MSKWSSAYRDSRWQKLRLQIMERDEWKCRGCSKGVGDGVTLNVHHSYYDAGSAPWEYPQETLVTFCEKCHTERHEIQKLILTAMSKTSILGVYGLLLMLNRLPCTLESISCYEDVIMEATNHDSNLDMEITDIVTDMLDLRINDNGGVK